MTRLVRLRAAIASHPHLSFAITFTFVALTVGFVTAAGRDRAGYLIGVAFALAAAIVVLFALELEEIRRGQ